MSEANANGEKIHLGHLGQQSAYEDKYRPELLYRVPRAEKRQEIGLTDELPFMGADLWTAYELSWLNRNGKPQVALLDITVPCESPYIVESKSLKLYLNSFNQTSFSSAERVCETIKNDLNALVWYGSTSPRSIGLRLIESEQFDQQPMEELSGLSLDRLDLDCSQYLPAPELLIRDTHAALISETLSSRLLKSNCLITGQPDWASVQISYRGAPIDHAGLLRYIVSFRQHNEFHEQCVERIFMDIWRSCKPDQLSVYARYTRRGGLDINPWRTSFAQAVPKNRRTARQ